MEYTQLGHSDLHVSKICLGCLSFGDKNRAGNAQWLLDQNQTNVIVKRALELGINFFDTANYYNQGTSEMYLGNAINKLAKREDVIIATKVYYNEGDLCTLKYSSLKCFAFTIPNRVMRPVSKVKKRLFTNKNVGSLF